MASFSLPRIDYIDKRPFTEIEGEYGQEISQSQTADKPMAPRGRASQAGHTPYAHTAVHTYWVNGDQDTKFNRVWCLFMSIDV